jgi:hypothetical protein
MVHDPLGVTQLAPNVVTVKVTEPSFTVKPGELTVAVKVSV